MSFDIEAAGYGALYSTPNPPANLPAFLKKMQIMTQHALAYYAEQNTVLKQKMIPIEPTQKYQSAPTGMILIPGNPSYTFQVSGIEIEGGTYYFMTYFTELFQVILA